MITVRVNGLDGVIRQLGGITSRLEETLQQAGEESARIILDTPGLQLYPPETAANQPPTPYYIRGRGMQLGGKTTEYNLMNSERLGTRWTVRSFDFTTVIGNGASYAPFVNGSEQAWFMARIGWRKIADVGDEKLPDITRIYQAWIDRLIKSLG